MGNFLHQSLKGQFSNEEFYRFLVLSNFGSQPVAMFCFLFVSLCPRHQLLLCSSLFGRLDGCVFRSRGPCCWLLLCPGLFCRLAGGMFCWGPSSLATCFYNFGRLFSASVCQCQILLPLCLFLLHLCQCFIVITVIDVYRPRNNSAR